MTYRTDPRRKAAARWHALLNNGMHYAAVDDTGRVHATGNTINAPALRAMMRHRPMLKIIRIDDQI